MRGSSGAFAVCMGTGQIIIDVRIRSCIMRRHQAFDLPHVVTVVVTVIAYDDDDTGIKSVFHS